MHLPAIGSLFIAYPASSARFLSAAPLSPSSSRYIHARHMAVTSPAITPLRTPGPLGSHNPPPLLPPVHPTLQRQSFRCRIHSTRPEASCSGGSPNLTEGYCW